MKGDSGEDGLPGRKGSPGDNGLPGANVSVHGTMKPQFISFEVQQYSHQYYICLENCMQLMIPGLYLKNQLLYSVYFEFCSRGCKHLVPKSKGGGGGGDANPGGGGGNCILKGGGRQFQGGGQIDPKRTPQHPSEINPAVAPTALIHSSYSIVNPQGMGQGGGQ